MDLIWSYVKEFLTSKKFTIAIAAIIVAALAKLNFNLPESLIQEIVAIAVAWLLAQGWADHGKEAEKVKSERLAKADPPLLSDDDLRL